MKLIALAALLNLSLLESSQAYRVELEKGKRSVRGSLTIEKINKDIQEMKKLGDKTFEKKPSYSNKKVLESLNDEPYFKKIVNSFLAREK